MDQVFSPASPLQPLGRRRTLRRLVGRLQHGQSVALIGDPGSGKTTTLRALAYLMESAGKLVRGVAAADAEALARSPWEAVFSLPPSTPAAEDALTHWRRSPRSLHDTERLLQSLSRPLVLMIDDVERLRLPLAFFSELRALSSRRQITLVLASQDGLSRLQERIAGSLGYASPPLNHLQTVYLGGISEQELAKLPGIAALSPAARAWLFESTGGYPSFCQKLGRGLLTEHVDSLSPAQSVACLDEELRAVWESWAPALRAMLAALIYFREQPASHQLVQAASQPAFQELSGRGHLIEQRPLPLWQWWLVTHQQELLNEVMAAEPLLWLAAAGA